MNTTLPERVYTVLNKDQVDSINELLEVPEFHREKVLTAIQEMCANETSDEQLKQALVDRFVVPFNMLKLDKVSKERFAKQDFEVMGVNEEFSMVPIQARQSRIIADGDVFVLNDERYVLYESTHRRLISLGRQGDGHSTKFAARLYPGDIVLFKLSTVYYLTAVLGNEDTFYLVNHKDEHLLSVTKHTVLKSEGFYYRYNEEVNEYQSLGQLTDNGFSDAQELLSLITNYGLVVLEPHEKFTLEKGTVYEQVKGGLKPQQPLKPVDLIFAGMWDPLLNEPELKAEPKLKEPHLYAVSRPGLFANQRFFSRNSDGVLFDGVKWLHLKGLNGTTLPLIPIHLEWSVDTHLITTLSPEDMIKDETFNCYVLDGYTYKPVKDLSGWERFKLKHFHKQGRNIIRLQPGEMFNVNIHVDKLTFKLLSDSIVKWDLKTNKPAE